MKILLALFFGFSWLPAWEKSDLVGIWQLEIHWDLSSCISDRQTDSANSFLLFDSTWLKMVTIENSAENKVIKREFVGKWRLESDSVLAIKKAWYSVDSSQLNHSNSSTVSNHQSYVNFGVKILNQSLVITGENFAPTIGKICQYKSVYRKKESNLDSAVFNRSYKQYLKK